MSNLLGIDIGTCSVKTIIIDTDNAQTLSTTTCEYPIQKPSFGYAEQNPEDWWNATVITVRQAVIKSGVNPESIVGIGLSGQMHGTVCLDKDGHIVTCNYLG
jgi:xylulokinase